MPLHVEILYGEYQFAAAFAVASLLALLAVVTLVLKQWVEWHGQRAIKHASAPIQTNSMIPGAERAST
jgi:sulfate transport system permease protein